MNKFITELIGMILFIPIFILLLLFFLIQVMWFYVGLTIVFSYVLSIFDPTLPADKCIYYGSSLSLLWGIVSKAIEKSKE